MDISTLVKKLEQAKDAYYNGKALISDAAYDILEDTLRELEPNHPFLSKIGAAVPVNGAWPKVIHSIPMSSLNKSQTIPELQDWTASCKGPYYISMKCDGLSVNLAYKNGRLVQALTRGDGTTGEDITRNVLLMKGAIKQLPKTLADGTPTPHTLYIRGEMICFKSDFKTYFPGESTPRSTSSGTAKRQTNYEKAAHLTVLVYQILSPERTWKTKQAEFETLEYLGFQTPSHSKANTITEVEALYNEYIASARVALDYEIDGLVIDINNTEYRLALGLLNNKPKGSRALKFPREIQPSVLRNIRWQLGSSGRVTPVAEFDVVILVGAQVKQATLHNISNIATLVSEVRPGDTLLRCGDRITVSRQGDVIPAVASVIGGGGVVFETPTNCPSCKGLLERDGEYLVCRNLDCEAQATGAVKRWVSKISVLHFGGTLIEALVEAKLIVDAADLYTLDVDAVADLEMSGRRVGATADKAINNLRAKMTLPLHVIVGSLGIPLIGRDMARTIVDAGFDSLQKMYRAQFSEIAAIPGMGGTKALAFVEGFETKMPLISKLLSVGIQVQQVSGPLVGTTFCMTGFRDPSLADAIEKAGGTMKSGVSKGLVYLIAQDPNSNSGKLAKARSLGTKVIGIDEAWHLFKELDK